MPDPKPIISKEMNDKLQQLVSEYESVQSSPHKETLQHIFHAKALQLREDYERRAEEDLLMRRSLSIREKIEDSIEDIVLLEIEVELQHLLPPGHPGREPLRIVH